ncbi:hypothetical protein HPB50_002750 [Hyalomma asiaticum]|uniref:Uncharacterized protein n=1 Tax=Hyalomma asiaticum TaxID=266040 RepID=A0ACB7TBG7_HYAAI|nr:hypothetical protein HPB50_002750 [Hyalomma asiaticum]
MTSVTSESKERMPTEEMALARPRTASNYRDVMDNMLTEPTEAVPPSLTTTQSTQQGPFRSKFMNDIRTMIKTLMSTRGAEMMRNLLQADISTDCTFGLLHFTRAIQDLEPWAIRLIDATGKYPTGLLQANFADLGAYDECVETVVRDEYGTTKVRGQYCDVHLLVNDEEMLNGSLVQAVIYYHKRVARFIPSITSGSLPGLRIGVCVIDACDEQDLAKIGRTLIGPTFNITVKDCVTNERGGINNVQVAIM